MLIGPLDTIHAIAGRKGKTRMTTQPIYERIVDLVQAEGVDRELATQGLVESDGAAVGQL